MTPAMLAKHRPATSQETPGEAWKRKRATSPVRRPSPRKEERPVWARQQEVRQQEVGQQEVMQQDIREQEVEEQQEERNAPSGIEQRVGKLAAAATPDWRDNEIAKKAAMEKKQEMGLLMNRSGSCYCSYCTSHFRYKHLWKDEESYAAPSTPTTKPKEKALFLYCFCFSKFCSFSASAPPRLLLPRPQRSTTPESVAWRE